MRLFAGHDVVQLIAVNGFPFQQSFRHGVHFVLVVFNQLAGTTILFIDDATNLCVHLEHGLLTHVGGFGHGTTQEDFAFVVGINHGAQRLGHTVAHHHVARQTSGTLKVVTRARGHLLHEHFFGNPATKQHGDLAEHKFAVIAVAVSRWQAHGHAQSTAARDDGHFMHRVALGQHFANQRMPGLMVSRVAALFLGHDHALAFRAHQDFVFGLLKILHLHNAGIATRRHQSRFVAQIGEISAAHAGRATGNRAGVDVLRRWDFAHVDIQNLFTSANIGQGDIHLTVKTARAKQSSIQNIRTVGCGHHNHAKIGFKTVHLDQHLVQCLLALVIATTDTGTTLAANGVDLVNKNDTRRVFLGVFKHVTHTRCAHADKHLNEV